METPISKSSGSVAMETNSDQKQSDQLLQEEEVAVCPPQEGYRVSVLKSVVFYPLAVFPLCLGLLVVYWLPHLWVWCTCRPCPLSQASYVIVRDLQGKRRVEKVRGFQVGGARKNPWEYSEKDPLISRDNELQGGMEVKYFVHRHLRYLYNAELGRYTLLKGFDQEYSCEAIHSMSRGLDSREHKERLLRYGPNSIEVPVKPYHVLFVEEVLHPFYVFQVASVIFWMLDEYYLYSCAVFFVSTLSMLISLLQTRRTMQQLHNMVKTSTTITVLRDGRVKDIPSEAVVVGDVLVVPPTGMMVPCDAALLSGNAIVNEAMLTGESVPVTKTPLPHGHAHYHPEKEKRHTLFGGTHVIQTRFYGNASVLAVVIRTGFATSKGGMVRSILYPKPLNMKFYADAIKFVLMLAVLAVAGFVYTLAIELAKGYQVKETILRAFDVITIVVPPALPAVLTVGTVYALNRLRKQQIYCISPQRVNLCGKIKLVCFDKTGTLTEDSLDLYGVQPVGGRSLAPLVLDVTQLPPGPLLYGMTTCHSLTSINGELTGDPLDLKMFLGTRWTLEEPGEVDCTRFDNLAPTVVRPPATSPGSTTVEELGILRQFTFSSDLQRMSVLVRALPSSDPRLHHVYVKGAPETIRRLCKPESMPVDFFERLGSLTQQGFRVLAMAHRTLHMPWHKAERVQRTVVESDLSFVGLIVMQNRLKPQTTPVISTLQQASIRTVMATGDNLLTAVSVARECGMVAMDHRAIMVRAELSPMGLPLLSYRLLGEGRDHAHLLHSASSGYASNHSSHASVEVRPTTSLPSINEAHPATPLFSYEDGTAVDLEGPFHLVVDGKTFAVIREECKDVFKKLLVKGTVFARMSPNQKAQLVTALMDIGYGVAMCGDGANDCGALKSAHAGISLSETEASVASPFTSKIPNITCVPKVIREGRAALVTSFGAFKFMALYSLCEFISAAILYAYESNLGDLEYLWIDLVLIPAFGFAMGYTGPYPHLVKRRPPGTLAGIHVMVSLCVQAALLLAFQVGALLYLIRQPWYEPLNPDKYSDNVVCYENTIIFEISIFQYVGLALALSTAAPYRKPLFTNYWFMLCLAVLIPLNLYLVLVPPQWWPLIWRWFELKQPPSLIFRTALLELAIFNCILAYFLEGYIFSSEWMRRVLRVVRCKMRPRNKYKHILASIDPDWPPCEVEGTLA